MLNWKVLMKNCAVFSKIGHHFRIVTMCIKNQLVFLLNGQLAWALLFFTIFLKGKCKKKRAELINASGSEFAPC